MEVDQFDIDYDTQKILQSKVIINKERKSLELAKYEKQAEAIELEQKPTINMSEYVKLYLHKVPNLQNQARMMDEIGIVLGLQTNLLDNFARYVGLHDVSILA